MQQHETRKSQSKRASPRLTRAFYTSPSSCAKGPAPRLTHSPPGNSEKRPRSVGSAPASLASACRNEHHGLPEHSQHLRLMDGERGSGPASCPGPCAATPLRPLLPCPQVPGNVSLWGPGSGLLGRAGPSDQPDSRDSAHSGGQTSNGNRKARGNVCRGPGAGLHVPSRQLSAPATA